MLNCVPVPLRLSQAGHPPTGGSAQGPSRLEWHGEEDARVSRRFEQLLGPLQSGLVRVEVTESLVRPPQLNDVESYRLRRDEDDALRLTARTTWGALHGLTTLYQLTRLGQLQRISSVSDAPRFPWRGLLIDTARHFMPLNVLTEVVDGMSLLKLNVLHLHLSDDQAFRFASSTFPRLASVDHYTQDALRDLVAYAADRGVRVVPELDMPGHTTSWLCAYPEWGAQPATPSVRFGVHPACLDPARDAVYQALDQLFAELAGVCPDRYVHIGGDEVHPAWWQADADIRALQHREDLEGPGDVQNWFNRQVVDLLAGHGKLAVGWDEVLHPEMPQMVVQNWRGASTRDRALAASLDCIVSAPYYLDLMLPAEMHYAFDPEDSQNNMLALEDQHQADPRLAHVAGGIEWTRQWRSELLEDHDGAGQVLGGEACLWSELVDAHTLPVRLWSRLPAVAERLWSPDHLCDVDSFMARLPGVLTLPPFEVAVRQQRDLKSLGLSDIQARVAMVLEPVKWYARLLGEAALKARLSGNEMPQARPYDANTPLNRVVDFISPESLSARALKTCSATDLASWIALFENLSGTDWPADVRPAIAALAQVGAVMADFQAGRILQEPACSRLESLYGPHGEYMLAPVPWLVSRLEAGVQAASDG